MNAPSDPVPVAPSADCPALADEGAPRAIWRVHPARERLGAAIAAGAVIALMAVAAGLLAGHPAWIVLFGAALLWVQRRFFFPTFHRLEGGTLELCCAGTTRSISADEVIGGECGQTRCILAVRTRDRRERLTMLLPADPEARERVRAVAEDWIREGRRRQRHMTAASMPASRAQGGEATT